MARSSNRAQSGRVRPHERDTNNEAPILGANVEVLEQHSSSVRETEQNDLSVKVKRDYRNRLKHMYTFWKEQYPEYYSVGVRELTEVELGDKDMFWWKNKHDVVYEGLNVQMVKAFLGHRKTKDNGKTSSHVQLRKYNDAILYGAKQAQKRLPQSYYEEIEKSIKAMSIGRRIQISKFVHDWTPTKHQLALFDNSIDRRCFACGNLKENVTHVFQCTSERRQTARASAITAFKEHLAKYHTPVPMANIILQCMEKWLTGR